MVKYINKVSSKKYFQEFLVTEYIKNIIFAKNANNENKANNLHDNPFPIQEPHLEVSS